MTRIVFVHGTGVRQPAFEKLFGVFRSRMQGIRDHSVDACFWGETAGATLLAGGKSIPSFSDSLDSESENGASSALLSANENLWSALEQNPFLELEELAKATARLRSMGRKDDAVEQFRLRLAQAFQPQTEVLNVLKNAYLDDVRGEALSLLLSSPAFETLAANPYVDDASKVEAFARAYVAVSLNLADRLAAGSAPIDGAHRDKVVGSIIDSLGGDARGMGGVLLGATYKVAVGLGALHLVERRRSALTMAAAPQAGDVLKYLVRGGSLRLSVKESLIESTEPVVIVAHSLGALASLELLASEYLGHVVQLITVGTQIGLLYELDAMPGLPFPSSMPESVPEWHNVLDRRDLLAYSAEGVFPGVVKDHYVNNRTSFPRSHSAYFGNDDFYRLLNELMVE